MGGGIAYRQGLMSTNLFKGIMGMSPFFSSSITSENVE